MEHFVAMRSNHVTVHEARAIKQHFFADFLQIRAETERLHQWKQQLHSRLSERIDSEPNTRIAYIHLQKRLTKGKGNFHTIPKFDQVAPELRHELQAYLEAQQQLTAWGTAQQEHYREAVKQAEAACINVLFSNEHLHNALLMTNFSMYETLHKHRSAAKQVNKIWKLVMRGFAKTAPLATFTSISLRDTDRETRCVEVSQSLLQTLYGQFLKWDEVLANSEFRVNYRLQDQGIVTRSPMWQSTPSYGLLGNLVRDFQFSAPGLQVLEPGATVSGQELISLLGGSTDKALPLMRQLHVYGFLINTAWIEQEEPSLADLIAICARFLEHSERVQQVHDHLIGIQAILPTLMHIVEPDARAPYLREARQHLQACFALSGEDVQAGIQDVFSESSYVPMDGEEEMLPDQVQDDLEKLKRIFPIFDHRLLFQQYVREAFTSTVPIPFMEFRSTLKAVAQRYEHCANLKQFTNSPFTEKGVGAALDALKRRVQALTAQTLQGHDVELSDQLLEEWASELERIGVESRCGYTIHLQRSQGPEVVVNHFQSSYFSFFARHASPAAHDRLLESLKKRIHAGNARIATFSPSYGFQPNRTSLRGEYELVDHTSGAKGQLSVQDCAVQWNTEHGRFELLAEGERILPLYLGSLGPSFLSEDLKLMTYLCQSGYLTGLTLDYSQIPLQTFRKVGRITAGTLILQRSKYIVHGQPFMELTGDSAGFLAFHELLSQYDIPRQSFVRLFPLRDGHLDIVFGDTGLQKPIFFDAEEPFYVEQLVKHIQRNGKKYPEVAIVFEEALPHPYTYDHVVKECLVEI